LAAPDFSNLSLAETKEGPHGLVVCELEIGDGPDAKPGETVHVEWTAKVNTPPGHYWNEKKNQTIIIGDVLLSRGLSMGICGMRPGGKRTILVPHQLLIEREGIPHGAVVSYEVYLYTIE
jgi:FKBP-type peptidyl-prolyl cis-trans isomerase